MNKAEFRGVTSPMPVGASRRGAGPKKSTHTDVWAFLEHGPAQVGVVRGRDISGSRICHGGVRPQPRLAF
jgi:hypothetical protein